MGVPTRPRALRRSLGYLGVGAVIELGDTSLTVIGAVPPDAQTPNVNAPGVAVKARA